MVQCSGDSLNQGIETEWFRNGSGEELSVGGVLNGHVDHRSLCVFRYSILQDGFLAGNFMQGRLATVLVQLPVAVEGVSTVTHDLASLGHIAQLLG